MQLSLDQTAVVLGKSVRQIRYMIQQGKLPAKKVNGRWVVERNALPRQGDQKHAATRRQHALRTAVDSALDIKDDNNSFSITDLRAVTIALPLYQSINRELGVEHAATAQLRKVLDNLSIGCHRFNARDKTEAYQTARDAASLAVCELLLTDSEDAVKLRNTIERELMPAMASLLRRTDRKSRQ